MEAHRTKLTNTITWMKECPSHLRTAAVRWSWYYTSWKLQCCFQSSSLSYPNQLERIPLHTCFQYNSHTFGRATSFSSWKDPMSSSKWSMACISARQPERTGSHLQSKMTQHPSWFLFYTWIQGLLCFDLMNWDLEHTHKIHNCKSGRDVICFWGLIKTRLRNCTRKKHELNIYMLQPSKILTRNECIFTLWIPKDPICLVIGIESISIKSLRTTMCHQIYWWSMHCLSIKLNVQIT